MSVTTSPARSPAADRRLVPLIVGGGPGGRGGATVAPSPQQGRVVIISATVGLGHEKAARELARRLGRRGLDVQVHDYLDALPTVVRRGLRDLYAPVVQYAPALFDHIFDGLEHQGVLRRIAARVCTMAEAEVERWTRDADVVVTTYPLAGQTLGALREQERLTAPAITYLTDPAAHATWCHPAIDRHLTVTRATAADAARYGVRARASGPLAAPHPDATRDRRAVRDELGLSGDAPVALISAGSLGMGAVPQTVGDLLAHPDLQVIVLCGRNARLRRRLDRHPRVVALGWRDDVPSVMAASDVLVHNAGGLALTEALTTGLPAITYLPIPGHGRANAAVLDRYGVARWAKNPVDLVAALDSVLAASPERGDDELWPRYADPSAIVHGVLAARLTPSLRGRTTAPGSRR